MVISESIQIAAPLAVVWRVFTALEEWEHWNSVCTDCRMVAGDAVSEGACLAFTIRPYFWPVRITPKVTRCVPRKEVLWSGRRLGVHAEHLFRFEDGETVRLTSIERFSGPMLPVIRLFWAPQSLHRLTRHLLEDIRARAESCSC